MGRRLNVSTPTVINTELVPLDESFYIDVDGQLEQWYYDNTEQYAPNRKVTPLLLVPFISAFDKDTSTSYTPAFYTTQWFESAYREDYSVRHDFGVSAHAQAETGREYPSDISSWLSFPEISYEAKPYLWHRITKTIGSSTTVTYELVQVNDTPAYVLGRALSYFPDEPEEGDMVVSQNANVDYYVYENGMWVDYYLNNGQAIDVTDLKELWVLVNDTTYGKWYKIPYSSQNGGYVETEITNTVDSGSADYVIQGNNLLVKKNVSYSHAVSIRCVATFIDPRDSGVTYAVEDSVNLTTNRTADVVFPEVDIISPSGRAYNPLVDDENSQYDFKGVTTNNPVQPLNTDVRRYHVDVDGTEEILNSGEAIAPIMDIRYGENPTMANQEFMYRQTAGGTLVGEGIDKAYIERIKGNAVAWNQLVRNGNFENFYYWDSQPIITLSVSNGVGSLTATSSGDGYSQNLCKMVIGHKYIFIGMSNSATSNESVFMIFFGEGYNYERLVQNTANVWEKKASLFTCISNTYNFVRLYNTIANTTNQFKEITLFDLTLIYGAGNEPTTVEEFEADYLRWFGKPLTYEEYDEGSLRPVLMSGIKTVGFNQWDEVWEVGYIDPTNGQDVSTSERWRTKNFIPVLPNTQYFIKSGTNVAFWRTYYDANKNYIGYDVETSGNINIVITTPANAAYMKFGEEANYPPPYKHDICINISNPSKNGTYEPYQENTRTLDVTTLKGKLNGSGNSVVIFPDGLKKAGNVYDEIKVEDGVVKAIKRVGSVDMGTLNWGNNPNGTGTFYTVPTGIKESGRLVTPLYIEHNVNPSSIGDKEITSYSTVVAGNIDVKDTTYSDTATFKSAMQGVMLYYELETPETYVLDPITDFVWYGIKNGQEVLADTLPWYVSGQGTDNLVVDAMYGENINVVLRCKMMDGETLSPSKAYATLSWRTPDIETFVQSDNGGAVRSDTKDMTFDTIVNVNGDVLTDALKQKHLAFNWKIRKNNTSTEIDKGWGQRITIDASDLRNVKGSGSTLASTIVGNEVYLKGAYEEVTDNGEMVTDGGEMVYDRPVN